MLKQMQLPGSTRVDHSEIQPVSWNVIADATNNAFTSLVDHMIDSKLSRNLDGAEGICKSTLLKQSVAKMDQKQVNYVCRPRTNEQSNKCKSQRKILNK